MLENIINKDTNFIVLWNNRNIRRKLPGDVILAMKHFVDQLPEEQQKNISQIVKNVSKVVVIDKNTEKN